MYNYNRKTIDRFHIKMLVNFSHLKVPQSYKKKKKKKNWKGMQQK